MAGFSVLISGVACSSVAFCSSAVWLCWADAGTAGIEGFGTRHPAVFAFDGLDSAESANRKGPGFGYVL
jgi:hypothetical protein